ncbi:MAG TPA: sialidase family protein, partial [Candidatus Bathyarchaeia archaeon]|nr:sialidase family protein [Candidatus Bathyarchaeia archaeon]
MSYTKDAREYSSKKPKTRLVKIAKLSLVLFATLFLSTAYLPQNAHAATASHRFPASHQDFLSPISADTFFGTSTAFSSSSSSPQVTVSPNVQVNAPQQPPPAGRLGRSETSIAVGSNGQNMVAGWNEANGFAKIPFLVPPTIPGTPGLSGVAVSTNAGSTWTDLGPPTLFPATTSFFSGNVVSRGDPWLTVAPVGGTETFFYANLAVFDQRDSNSNIVDAGVSVHRGTFTGTSFAWNDLHLLSAPNAPFDSYDKESIAARQVGGQTIVAVAVTNFVGISTPGTNPANCQFAGGFGQIEVWRSSDGGNSFQGPVVVQPDQTNTVADPNCTTGILNQGASVIIGPDGSIVVAWTNGPKFVQGNVVDDPTEQILAAGSTDGGKTFSSPILVQKIVPGRQNPPVGFNRARTNDFPRVAVSDSGTFFLAFQDAVVAGNQGIGGSDTICLTISGPPSIGDPCDPGQQRVMVGGGADTDIYLSSSTDHGTTWTAPSLINPVAGDGKIQFWPTVSVGAHGEVNVVYYQSQEVHLSADPLAADCTVSVGGGLVRRSLRASLVDTFFQQSLDGGKTFTAPVRVSTVTSNWCQGAV